jgi:hypothetical protein
MTEVYAEPCRRLLTCQPLLFFPSKLLQFLSSFFAFFDEGLEFLYVLIYFGFLKGFAYSVDYVADVCGEADPVLFKIVFRRVSVYDFCCAVSARALSSRMSWNLTFCMSRLYLSAMG